MFAVLMTALALRPQVELDTHQMVVLVTEIVLSLILSLSLETVMEMVIAVQVLSTLELVIVVGAMLHQQAQRAIRL